MLDGTQDFVRLPREKVLITSPSRTTLGLQTPNSYPGKEPLSIKCGDGKAIITSQRVRFLTLYCRDTALKLPIAHIRSSRSDLTAAVPLCTSVIPARHSRHRSLFRTKRVGRDPHTNSRRRILATAPRDSNQANLQRRGRLRLPFHI